MRGTPCALAGARAHEVEHEAEPHHPAGTTGAEEGEALSTRRSSVAPPLSRRMHIRPICGSKGSRSISVRHGGAPATARSRWRTVPTRQRSMRRPGRSSRTTMHTRPASWSQACSTPSASRVPSSSVSRQGAPTVRGRSDDMMAISPAPPRRTWTRRVPPELNGTEGRDPPVCGAVLLLSGMAICSFEPFTVSGEADKAVSS
jgi:hypothetical protein